MCCTRLPALLLLLWLPHAAGGEPQTLAARLEQLIDQGAVERATAR